MQEIERSRRNSPCVRDCTLHSTLESFTTDAAAQLSAETASGAEIPFEVIDAQGQPGRVPLYCYQPLTSDFIGQRLGMLSALSTYAPAARALASFDRVTEYLNQRGEPRIPPEPRERADSALMSFLGCVFADRSEFDFDPVRFELAYAELERALYDGHAVTVVIAPLLGIALDPRHPGARARRRTVARPRRHARGCPGRRGLGRDRGTARARRG